jgi:conjugal transfer pilin signal peptidase TrbI
MHSVRNWIEDRWRQLPQRNRRLFRLTLIAVPLLFACAGVACKAVAAYGTLYVDENLGLSTCLPWDVYVGRYRPKQVRRGDIVSFRIGKNGVFEEGTVLAKIVAGVEGDVVEIRHGVLSINGRVLGDVRRGVRRLNKPPTFWDTRYVVGKDEFFMLGTEYRSFDSRYWGVITGDQIVAKLTLVA